MRGDRQKMKSKTSTIENRLDSNPHYMIYPDGSVEFTSEGVTYYLPYYQQMGIDIQTITTTRRLLTANKIIRPLIWEELENDLLSKTVTLERLWLLSLLRCDMDEFERLYNLIKKRKTCQLRLVPKSDINA